MRTQIMELESMKDLLLVTKHFVFKMSFGGVNVYYSGMTSNEFVGLNVFITKEDYTGILGLDGNDNIVNKDARDSYTISVIPVMVDSLIRPILANYVVNKFGITRRMISDMGDLANKMIMQNVEQAGDAE